MIVSVWSKNVPYPDLEPARFEVDLNKVLRGEGPEEYRDPEKFFSITYATREIKDILRDINRALTRRTGLIQALLSPFGGGKTHALLVIYHAFSNPDAVPPERSADDPHGFPKPSVKAKVIAFDGRDVPAGGKALPRTLWGAIARELGRYDDIREYDVQMTVPELSVLLRMLRAVEPAIILLDELPAYLERAGAVGVRETTLARLTITFLHSFLGAVKGSRVALLVSIPEGAYAFMSAEAEQLMRDAKAIIRRIAEFRAPLAIEELGGVLKKRLFKHVDEAEGVKVARRYVEFYEKRREALPSHASNAIYLEQLTKHYPFHPSFIDLLTERIVAIPGFQRTRGMLRLMAAVVAAIKDNEEIRGVIMPGDVDLSDELVLNELLREEYGVHRAVIENDIATKDGSARSQRLSKEKPMAVRVATVTFLNSFTLAGKDLAEASPTAAEIALQVVRPNENPYEVQDTLQALLSPEAGLFFIQGAEGRHFFTVVPNVNRLIEQEEAKITDAGAERWVRGQIERKYSGWGPFGLVLSWKAMPTDEPTPRLVILDLHEGAPEGEVPSRAVEMWERFGTTFRTYQNALIFAYPTPPGAKRLVKLARRYLAIDKLLKREASLPVKIGEVEDKTLTKVVKEINRKRLEAERKKMVEEIETEVVRAYANFAYPTVDERGKSCLKPLGADELVRRGETITNIASRALGPEEGEGQIVDKLIPQFILDNVIKPQWERGAIVTVERVRKTFFEDPSLPMPISKGVIWKAVEEGVKAGLFDANVPDVGEVFHKREFDASSYPNALLEPPRERILEREVIEEEKILEPQIGEIQTIEPSNLSAEDRVVGFKAESIEQLRTLLTSWGFLNSILAPEKVSVTIDVSSENARFSVQNLQTTRTDQLYKLRTIVEDLNRLTKLTKVIFEIGLEGAQPLSEAGKVMFEKIRDLNVSEIKIVKSSRGELSPLHT